MAAGHNVVPKKQTVIWLATEDASTPFEHVIGDDCDCPICKERGDHTIILTQ